jgi:hypothetical protein
MEILCLEDQVTILRSIVGRKFQAVFSKHYNDSSGISEEPLEVWLSFAGLNPVSFFGKGTGEGLNIDLSPPIPLDTGKAGEYIIRDLTEKTPFKSCVNKVLVKTRILSLAEDCGIIGIYFDFENSDHPLISCWGDEIYFTDGASTLIPSEYATSIRELDSRAL